MAKFKSPDPRFMANENVKGLVESIGESLDLSMVPILHDALEELGCDNPQSVGELLLIQKRIDCLTKFLNNQAVEMDYEGKHEAFFISDKWVRVVVWTYGELFSRVYCFVALDTCCTNKKLGLVEAGDIHMPASWAGPAKHARGTVFAKDFGGRLGLYGP